jgi:hypothetical protein
MFLPAPASNVQEFRPYTIALPRGFYTSMSVDRFPFAQPAK